MRMLLRLGLGLLTLALLGCALIVLAYETIPTRNTAATHFDTLIVLGAPTQPDGSVSPDERERVLEAVRQFRAGVAPHLIVSGAAAHNRFVEAEAMARFAEQQGVPADAVLIEAQARNTIQNIFYSDQLMQAHGWHSAEVVSSPNHLPRAALILAHYHLAWRTDAARWPPEYERSNILVRYLGEALYCTRLRLFGFAPTPFLPMKP